MTNLEMWAIIVGFLAPPVIAVIQQPMWSQPVRAFVTLVVCAVIGLGNVYFNGEFAGSDWVRSVLLVLIAAISSYKGLWKPTSVAPSIESATSPGSAASPA